MCLAVAAANQAVKENRAQQTLRVLSLPDLQLRGVLPDCAAAYQQELSSRLADRTRPGEARPGEARPGEAWTLVKVLPCPGAERSPWVQVQLDDGSCYYFHLSRLEGSWEVPDGFQNRGRFLTRQDMQVKGQGL